MAFAKVILLGEHAVVHGHPALAAALALGATARAEPRPTAPTTLQVPAWKLQATTRGDDPVARALRAIVRATDAGPCDIYVDARVPPASGLGSSAALAVAVARALAPGFVTARIEQVANEAERCFHSNPSGVDVALAARGGIGVFRRGEGLQPLEVAPVPLVIGMSRAPRTTGPLVERVAAALRDDPAGVGARLQHLGDAALAGADALRAHDYNALGALFDKAHAELAALELSTPELDELVRIARHAGALGAKLTGAGGGGAVIALAPGREQDVVDAWSAAGYGGFASTAGVRG